jgi:hypothetical protein
MGVVAFGYNPSTQEDQNFEPSMGYMVRSGPKQTNNSNNKKERKIA